MHERKITVILLLILGAFVLWYSYEEPAKVRGNARYLLRVAYDLPLEHITDAEKVRDSIRKALSIITPVYIQNNDSIEGSLLTAREPALKKVVLSEREIEGVPVEDLRLRMNDGFMLAAYYLKGGSSWYRDRRQPPPWFRLIARAPAILVIHGHGRGREELLAKGNCHNAAALALAKRGFNVLVPDLRGFGDSSTGYYHHSLEARNRYHDNRRIFSFFVEDCLTLIDYLESFDDVEHDRIGISGISLGGAVAMFVSALDERVASTLIGGFFSSFAIKHGSHCPCTNLPEIAAIADMPEVASLSSPRWLMIANGNRDMEFPVSLVEPCYHVLEHFYLARGGRGRVFFHVFNGGHEFPVELAIRWFENTLGWHRSRRAR